MISDSDYYNITSMSYNGEIIDNFIPVSINNDSYRTIIDNSSDMFYLGFNKNSTMTYLKIEVSCNNGYNEFTFSFDPGIEGELIVKIDFNNQLITIYDNGIENQTSQIEYPKEYFEGARGFYITIF